MEAIEKIAKDTLDELKNDYPAFLIESHFQYEFALVLAKKYKMDVHLERYAKPNNIQNNIVEIEDKSYWRVDLEARDGEGNNYMFEFKYLTAQVDVKVPNRNVTFHLKQQSGGKVRKIAVWRDIEKLEFLKSHGECTQACFVMLANDWRTINSHSRGENSVLDIYNKKQSLGADFSYTIKRQGITMTREIHIKNSYKFEYEGYSKINDPKGTEDNRIFRSLILPIK